MVKRIDHLVNFLVSLAAMYVGWLVSLTPWSTGVRLGVVFAAWLAFSAVNVVPRWRLRPTFRLIVLAGGVELLVQFLVTMVINLSVGIGVAIAALCGWWDARFWWAIIGVLAGELLLFWNGMLRLYCTSAQLGVRWRVIGLLCGWIPLVNIGVLVHMLRLCYREVVTESDRLEVDAEQVASQPCRTRYPVVLVHGVFFRDNPALCYWGRIPKTLEKNGAKVYFGEQQSATSVEGSAKELAARIRTIVEETGCEKVNLIAHSKGGLDSRYAISCLGMADYVASLTTVNTPHHGCHYVDHLLDKTSDGLQHTVEDVYNRTFRKLGDEYPDFMSAVMDLTPAHCRELNDKMPDADGVYYQSVGSWMQSARSGRFPLTVSYPLAKRFDGDNDGLVEIDSMRWGERFIRLDPPGKRGISHADVIDLNRENIPGFDVREFYIDLLKDLRQRGF